MKKLVVLFFVLFLGLVGFIVYKNVDNVKSDNDLQIILPNDDCEHKYEDGKCVKCGQILEEDLNDNFVLTTSTGAVISGKTFSMSETKSYDFFHNLGVEFNNKINVTYNMTGTVDLSMQRYENNVKVDEFESPKTLDVSKFTNQADIGFKDSSEVKYEATNLLRFVEPENYIDLFFISTSPHFIISVNSVSNNLFNTEDGTENYNGTVNPENGVKAILVGYDLTIRVTLTESENSLTTYFDIKLES